MKIYFELLVDYQLILSKGLKNLEKNSDYKINYFDKFGNPSEKPEMTLPIPEGMTATAVVNKYFEAIGGKEKAMAVKTTMMVSNATIQGTPLVMTTKASAPNKTLMTISVMGNTMQKVVFDGEKNSASGTLKFDRQKYGVAYKGSKKDMLVGDEVEMTISLNSEL